MNSEYGEHKGPRDAGNRGGLAPHETERDVDLLGGRDSENMEPHREVGLRQPHQPNGESTLHVSTLRNVVDMLMLWL